MRTKLATLLSVAGLLCTLTLVASPVLAANPSANLDQCANDPAPSFSSDGCNSLATQWVNGNLGASKSVYAEGDSIPYRLTFSNIATNRSHDVKIEWDTTKQGVHAIDYLTTYTRSVLDANACLGITQAPNACGSVASTKTFGIPKDPQVDNGSGSPIVQPAGFFTIYGGNITGVSSYSYSTGTGFAGDKSASIVITFTTDVTNPVIAWGGHIAQRQPGNGSGGWGPTLSAVSISGSPYHTRLLDLDGSGGNQDRSLSAAAVIFPGSITVIKDVDPGTNAQDFGFSTTGGLSPATFSLDDDSDNTLSNTQLFGGLKNVGATYTVTEAALGGWSLTGLSCSRDISNGGSSSTTLNTRTASITLGEGENWTCTFTNFKLNSAMTIVKTVTSLKNPGDTTTDSDGIIDEAGDVIHYQVVVSNTGNTTLTGVTVSDNFASNLDCDSVAAGNQTGPFTILVGGSKTCTATHVVSQAELDAGGNYDTTVPADGQNDVLRNVATADSDQTAPVSDDATVPVAPAPSLSITKVDNYGDDPVQKFEKIDDVITYVITVTNTGNTTLTGVTVTDLKAPNLDCDPIASGNQTGPFTINVGSSLTCSASHTIVQADLDAGHFLNTACADDGVGGAASKCDDEDTPGKNQPTIETTDTLIPKDHIVLSGLSTNAGGTLWVALRINEACDAQTTAPYSTSFTVTGPTFTRDVTSDVAVSDDATIRWCTKYSGDANNAARDWANNDEVIAIDFFPLGQAGAGFGAGALAMLAYSLWSRRRRERED